MCVAYSWYGQVFGDRLAKFIRFQFRIRSLYNLWYTITYGSSYAPCIIGCVWVLVLLQHLCVRWIRLVSVLVIKEMETNGTWRPTKNAKYGVGMFCDVVV